MIQLQLQKAKLDQQIKKEAGKAMDEEEPIDEVADDLLVRPQF